MNPEAFLFEIDRRFGRDQAPNAVLVDEIALLRHKEAAAARDFFHGRPWWDYDFEALSDAVGEPASDILVHLTPAGRAYHLPAFLRFTVRLLTEPDNARLDAFVDGLCFQLTRTSETAHADIYAIVKDMPEVPEDIKAMHRSPSPEARAAIEILISRFDEFQALLSAEQRHCVAAVLQAVAPLLDGTPPLPEHNNARRALAYWA